jgi:hypothetical protein
MRTKPNYGTNFVSARVVVRIHLPRPTAERLPLILVWLNHPHPAEHGLVVSTQRKIFTFPSCSDLFSMTKRCLKTPASNDTILKGIFTMVAISLTFAQSRENSRFLAEFCAVRFRVGRAKLPTTSLNKAYANPFPAIVEPTAGCIYSDLARTGLSAIYRLIRRLPPHFHYITQNPEREKSPFRARISISTE